MKLYLKRMIFFVLTIIWMSLIFLLSSQTADTSGELSGELIDKILNIFDRKLIDFDISIVNFMQIIIRKCAHMFLYIVLSILVLLELLMYDIKKQFLISGVISSYYAISDEIHQYFVQGRSCELRDVLIDIIGVIMGILIVKILHKLQNKTRKLRVDKSI